MRVLIFGGTAEARTLAGTLHDIGLDVVSSLAGRVSSPRLPEGPVRIGGFGGVAGLTDYLRRESVTACVDATHPFAVQMSSHAVQSSIATGIPLVRLMRPGWVEHRHARTWHWVDSYDRAVEQGRALGKRPFITTGRQTLAAFASWGDLAALVRVVEPLNDSVSPRWTVTCDRGPYQIAAETELMARHGVDVLVTKDSGGSYTAAKLDAAQELGVPVVIVTRPIGGAILNQVESVTETVAWLREQETAS